MKSALAELEHHSLVPIFQIVAAAAFTATTTHTLSLRIRCKMLQESKSLPELDQMVPVSVCHLRMLPAGSARGKGNV